MTTRRVVELCRGTGCDLAPWCHHNRYIPRNEGYAIKERIPTLPGERCPDYKPRTKPRMTWDEDND